MMGALLDMVRALDWSAVGESIGIVGTLLAFGIGAGKKAMRELLDALLGMDKKLDRMAATQAHHADKLEELGQHQTRQDARLGRLEAKIDSRRPPAPRH